MPLIERSHIEAGQRYRLPSSNVIQVDHIGRGNVVLCIYIRKSERFGMVAPGDQVALRCDWMQRHAQAVGV